jgi:hypothetical protein
MSDFLSRQAGRLLGVIPIVQPVIAPRFAQGPELLSDTSGDWLEQVAPAQASAVSALSKSTPDALESQPASRESDAPTSPPASAADMSEPLPGLLEDSSPGNPLVADDQRYTIPLDSVDDLTTARDVQPQPRELPPERNTLERNEAATHESPLLEEPAAGRRTPAFTVEPAFETEVPSHGLSHDSYRSVHEPDIEEHAHSDLTVGQSPETSGRVDYVQEDSREEIPGDIPDDKSSRPPSTAEVAPSFQVGQSAPGEFSPNVSSPPATGPSVVPSTAGPREIQGNALQKDGLPVAPGEDHEVLESAPSSSGGRSVHEPDIEEHAHSDLTVGPSPGTPGRVDYPQTDFQQETPEDIPNDKATQLPSPPPEATPSLQVGQPAPGELSSPLSSPPPTGPSPAPSTAGPREPHDDVSQRDGSSVAPAQGHEEPGWAQPAEASGLTNTGTSDKLPVAGAQGSSEGVESPENSGDRPDTPEQHSPNPVEAIDPIPRMRHVASLQQGGLPDLSPPPTRSQQIPGDGTSTIQGAQSPGIPAESLMGITGRSPDSESIAPGTQEVSSKRDAEEGQAPVTQRQTSLQSSSSLESARRPEFDEPQTGPSSSQAPEMSGEAPVDDLSELTPAPEVAADREAQIFGPETSPRIGTDGPSNQEERAWSQVPSSPDRDDSPTSKEHGGEFQNVPQPPESIEFIKPPGLFAEPKPETSGNTPDTGIPGLPTPFEGVVRRQRQAPEAETPPRTAQDRPSNQEADSLETSSGQEQAGTPPIEKAGRSPGDTAQTWKTNELAEHLGSQSSIENVSRQPFPLQPMRPGGRPSKRGVPVPSNSSLLGGSDGRDAGNRSSAGSRHIYQSGQPEAVPMVNGTDEGQEGGMPSTQVPSVAEERSGTPDEVAGPTVIAPVPTAQEGQTSPERITGTAMPNSRGRVTNPGLGPEGLSDRPGLPVGRTGSLERRRGDDRQGDVPEPTDQPIQRQTAPPGAASGAFTTSTDTPATPSAGTLPEGAAGPVALGESRMAGAPLPLVDNSDPTDINWRANNQHFGRGFTLAKSLPVGAGPSGHTPNRSSEVPRSDHNSLASPAPDRPGNPPMPLSGDSISASADVSHNDAGHQSDSGGPELVAPVPRRWPRAGTNQHSAATPQTSLPEHQTQAFPVASIPGDSGLRNYLETHTRATRPGRPAEQNTSASAPGQSDIGSGSPASPGNARGGDSVNGGASDPPMQSPEESSAELLPQGGSELESSLQRSGLVQSLHGVFKRSTDRGQELPSSFRSDGPFWRPVERERSKPATTRVNIGRIEVRAPTPLELSPAPKTPRPDPRLTLDEYLKRRDGKQS